MGIIYNLGKVAKSVRRTLKLSPMHNIFRSLKRYDFTPETLTTLEMFGWKGEIHRTRYCINCTQNGNMGN